MRRAFVFVSAILLAGGFVFAQTHSNMTEKTVKADFNLSSDVRVGTTILRAGEYRVQCNRETITFTPAEGGKPVKFPCKGAELSKPSARTELHFVKDEVGVTVLEKLLLKGSTVEHTFD
jgi:hypothetical protein